MLSMLKAYLAHVLATLAVLLGISSVVYVTRNPIERIGASFPGPCRQIGVSKWECSTATDWKLCAADASITCVPPAIPPPADGGLETVFMLADFQATGVTCDGGFPCVGMIRRYMPGMNAGGVYVTPGWSTIDTPVSSDLSAPLAGATAVINYVSGQPAGTMYCPIASAVSCVFDVDYMLPYVASSYDAAIPEAGDANDGSDSGGVDAADAADAADANDSGPAPTLSSANPLVALNTQTMTVHGTGFSNGTPTACFDGTGAACTSGLTATLTVSSDILATVIVPAITENGSAHTILVNSTGGTSATKSFYSPDKAATCPYVWVASADTETIATGVSDLVDNSRTYHMVQATGANQPTAATGAFSVSTTPSLHFASTQTIVGSSLPGISQPVTAIAMAYITNASANMQMTFASTAGVRIYFQASTAYAFAGGFGANIAATNGAHLIIPVFSNSVGTIYQDGVQGTSGAAGTNTSSTSQQLSDGVFTGDIFLYAQCSSIPDSTHRGYWHSVSTALIGSP